MKIQARGFAVAACILSLLSCAFSWSAWRASLRGQSEWSEGIVNLWEGRAARAEVEAAVQEGWLTGDAARKFATVERHLRGLDVAMAEIGYRYEELHHAQRERNWDYAKYQTEKIEYSLRLALERRPKRAKSSEPFLEKDLPAVLKAIEARDEKRFDAALERLHASCVECHKSENVLYFRSAVDRLRERAKRSGQE